jgi:hypothetical protein
MSACMFVTSAWQEGKRREERVVKNLRRGMCSRTRVEMMACCCFSPSTAGNGEVVVGRASWGDCWKGSQHSNLSSILDEGETSLEREISNIFSEKSNPMIWILCPAGQGWERSFDVFRPVPQPRSRIRNVGDEEVEDGDGDTLVFGVEGEVTVVRKEGNRTESSTSSIACSMLPSVS